MTATVNRKLKKGLHVVCYDDPITAQNVEAVGVLDRFKEYHSASYLKRKLELWTVRFSACDPVVERWVCADDIQD